jgi:hypothetical protein
MEVSGTVSAVPDGTVLHPDFLVEIEATAVVDEKGIHRVSHPPTATQVSLLMIRPGFGETGTVEDGAIPSRLWRWRLQIAQADPCRGLGQRSKQEYAEIKAYPSRFRCCLA